PYPRRRGRSSDGTPARHQRLIAEPMTELQKIDYSGWANSYRLTNGRIELVVTTAIGPRIIHFGFVGGENELKVFDEMRGKSNGAHWHPYGGHRLWHAPEQNPRTYYPDNNPAKLEDHGAFIRTIQPIDRKSV